VILTTEAQRFFTEVTEFLLFWHTEKLRFTEFTECVTRELPLRPLLKRSASAFALLLFFSATSVKNLRASVVKVPILSIQFSIFHLRLFQAFVLLIFRRFLSRKSKVDGNLRHAQSFLIKSF
jgi:hypothetical protein